MMAYKALGAVSLIWGLTANTASAIEITVNDDPYKPEITYTTPVVEFTEGEDKVSWYIEGTEKREEGIVSASLKFVVSYPYKEDWRHYDKAYYAGEEIETIYSFEPAKDRSANYTEGEFTVYWLLGIYYEGGPISIKLGGDVPKEYVIDISEDTIQSLRKAMGI